MDQQTMMTQMAETLKQNVDVLQYAQNIGNAIVDGPANHCAATLSALLIFAGIYPNSINMSTGNLQPWVPSLVSDLQMNLNWTKVSVADEFVSGDVGVVMLDTIHHVYLVIDATDPAKPLIADNRSPSPHVRAVNGDPQLGWSPTTFFLRAPST